MSKESEIMREHIRTHRTVLSMCNEPEDVILNRLLDDFDSKDQRIAELEEQLKNAIVPKFKVGQTVWYIYGKSIKSFTISEIEVEIRLVPLIAYSNPYIYQYEENCFTTKEEAQATLQELRGKDVKD